MISAILLLAAHHAQFPMAVGAKPTPWDAEACTASLRAELPSNAETQRPISGFRLGYLLVGDFKSLLSVGDALEARYPQVRTTMLPILKNNFVYSVEFDGFSGSQSDWNARTSDVCSLAIEHDVTIVGWQLLDGNKTAAGSYQMVGQ